MMILKELFLASALFMTCTACSKDSAPVIPEPVEQVISRIYPKPYDGWVGDVMPYYDNGQFEIFFLHDAPDQVKQSSKGEHAIHKYTSKTLIDFHYEGEMIPYGSVQTQDHLLGTGSTVKVGDTYYFYYTGHNGSGTWLDNSNPAWVTGNSREAVMVATSTDLKNWTKNETFILKAPEGYTGFDFRDPHVFFNEEFGIYWLLVSTQQNGKGVLLRYTSQDPASGVWEPKGPLEIEGDYLMLECADIFKMGNLYYLLFAEDWSGTPGTHYRVANSSIGPWQKPDNGKDMFDGYHFYAGKTASDGSKRYAFGWAHRRKPERDSGQRTWAGNLIIHELKQQADGSLGVESPDEVKSLFDQDEALQIINRKGQVTGEADNLSFDGTASAAYTQFGPLQGTQRVDFTLSFEKTSGTFELIFDAEKEKSASYYIAFEPEKNRIAAYHLNGEITRIPFDMQANKAYQLSLLIDGSVAVLYVDGKVALTNRFYALQQGAWAMQASNLIAKTSHVRIAHAH